MTNKIKILVTGSTGQQGGVVARALLEKGHHVRALTRSPESSAAQALRQKGAEVVAGDLMDRASLTAAVEGMDAVFGVTTPFEVGVENETKQGIHLVDAAKEAGISHLLFTSVGSAHKNTGIPHFDSKYEVEKYLRASGVPFTIIGPVFFMENWLSPWFLPSLKEGNVALALPGDRSLAQIAIEDIGHFAAHIFEHPRSFLGKRLDIAADDLSGLEVAKSIGAYTGRELGYFEIPLPAVREQNPDFAAMFEWFDEVGYQLDIDGLKRDYPEVGWTRFDTWVERQDWSVLEKTEKKAS